MVENSFMHINPNSNDKNNISFGASRVNICAFSDLHGNIKELIPLYASISKNVDDVFINKSDKSSKNIMTIVGDFFFNPGLKGFVSDKTKCAGDFQLLLLQKFLATTKKIVPGMKTLFTPGNHDLDAGDKFLFNLLKKAKMQTVMTNIDFSSKEIAELTRKESKHFLKSKVITVVDDKNPEIKNKVMMLGLTPPGLDYYFPHANGMQGITDNLKVLDRFKHLEADTQQDELNKTYSVLIDKIKSFKDKNPDSPVVILAHTGDKIAKYIATTLEKEKAHVDFILSGHDHMVTNEILPDTKTQIISLSEDGKLFKSLQLHFSDQGKLDSSEVKTFISNQTPELNNNPIQKTFDDVLSQDNKPILKTNPANTILSQESVRSGNSQLANTITDIILNGIKQKDPEVAAVGISSTAFRRGISNASTNTDILNVLGGSIEPQSIIQSGEVSGETLAKFIIEDIWHKSDNKKNNYPIVQWAGIRINRTQIAKSINKSSHSFALNNQSYNMAKYIEIMNQDGKYEPLDIVKKYKIALPNKFFVRSNIESIKTHQDKFTNINNENTTLNDLLIKHLKENDYNINVSDDIRVM